MNKIAEDFVSKEEKTFRFSLGTSLASALTGFIAGFVVASVIFYVLLTVQ